MSRRLPPRKLPPRRVMPNEARAIWLLVVLRTIVLALVAYVVATILFYGLEQVSLLPNGPLWDPSYARPLLYGMVLVVICLLAVLVFQSDWGSGVRTFSLFAAIVILAYAVLYDSKLLQADVPVHYAMTHVFEPFRRSIGR